MAAARADAQLCPLWMAPALQGRFDAWRVGRVQSSVRPVRAAAIGLVALMGSANRVPFCLSGCDALDKARVVPVPGLTGLAITSRRSPQPPEAELRGLPPLLMPPASARSLSGRSRRWS